MLPFYKQKQQSPICPNTGCIKHHFSKFMVLGFKNKVQITIKTELPLPFLFQQFPEFGNLFFQSIEFLAACNV